MDKKKFIDVIDVDEWEVLTSTGYKPINKIMKTIEYQVYRVEFNSGNVINCADNHIFIGIGGNEIYAKDLVQGTMLKSSLFEPEIVKSVTALDYYTHMYDIEINSREHTYYTNDVLSHNTTTAGAYLLWSLLFNTDFHIIIVHQSQKQANKVLHDIKNAFMDLPFWLQHGVKVWNKTFIELDNNSYIKAVTSTNARGDSTDLIYIDELSYIKNPDEFWAATIPTTASRSKSKIIVTSTPKGMDFFYKIYIDAVAKINEFKYMFVHYTRDPKKNNEKWIKSEKQKIGNSRIWATDYECSFTESSSTLVNGAILEKVTIETPLFFNQDEENKNYRIYEKPLPDHIYSVTVDVSEGIGSDYSVINVIDVTELPFKQVLLWRSNIASPFELAPMVNEIGLRYNTALVTVENNSIGKSTCDSLFNDYEYPNLYESNPILGEERSTSMNSGGRRKVVGIRMTSRTRPIGCTTLKGLIESGNLVIRDNLTLAELCVFEEIKGKYQATRGNNDDIVMTLISFGYLVAKNVIEYEGSISMEILKGKNSKHLLETEGIEEVFEDDIPMVLYDDGISHLTNDSFEFSFDNIMEQFYHR